MSRKLFRKTVFDYFEREGYHIVDPCFLSVETVSHKKKLDCVCPEGHAWITTWNNFQQGRRCRVCRGRPKIDLDFIREEFKKRGCQLLSKEYISSRDKVQYICSEGHTNSISWSSFNKGHSCRVCADDKFRFKFDFIKNKFEEKGYRVLSTEYLRAGDKLLVVCPNGHKIYKCWSDFNRGQGCYTCANNNRKVGLSRVRKEAALDDYELLSDSYVGNFDKLIFRCPKNHVIKISWANFKVGIRCKECFIERKRLDFSYVQDYIEKEGFILLSQEYVVRSAPLQLRCSLGHLFNISWDNFKQRKRCSVCFARGRSGAEEGLIKSIRDFYSGKIIIRTRKVISPYELDIYLPEIKVAIEYCGLYWHIEVRGKDKDYYRNKMLWCHEKGVRLITVFEDEYVHNCEMVLSRIRSVVEDVGVPFFDKRENIIRCDLRWDSLWSKTIYQNWGFELLEEIPPKLFYSKKQRRYAHPVKGYRYTIWDCGHRVYGQVGAN